VTVETVVSGVNLPNKTTARQNIPSIIKRRLLTGNAGTKCKTLYQYDREQNAKASHSPTTGVEQKADVKSSTVQQSTRTRKQSVFNSENNH